MKRLDTLSLLAALALLYAGGAPPRRQENDLRPAPHLTPRLTPGRGSIADRRRNGVFTTIIAPGTKLGGNFDDDGFFRKQLCRRWFATRCWFASRESDPG